MYPCQSDTLVTAPGAYICDLHAMQMIHLLHCMRRNVVGGGSGLPRKKRRWRHGQNIGGSGVAWPAQTTTMCAVAHSYNAAAIRRPICRRFGTEPEPTGSGPNQGSGGFGYYFGYLTTRVRVVNSGPGNPGTR